MQPALQQESDRPVIHQHNQHVLAKPAGLLEAISWTKHHRQVVTVLRADSPSAK